MSNLRTLQEQFRSQLDHNEFGSDANRGRLLSRAEFRHAAACERLRIYRNNSGFVVLLLEWKPCSRTCLCDESQGTNQQGRFASQTDAIDFLSRCLSSNVSPIDSYGLTGDGRIGVLLPDFDLDEARGLSNTISAECEEAGCHITTELVQFPNESIDNIADGDKQRRRRNAGQRNAAAKLFALDTPVWKRAIDIVGALAGLTISLPFILIGALLIKLSSKGTAIYQQERTGQAGRPFTINKIRTMQMGADSMIDDMRHLSDRDGPAFKLKNDPRTLFVGRLLRKLSIDELPQLWNVLIGEMSLVGPRPLPTHEADQLAMWQQERLDAKPGITGPWQVSGRNHISFDQWMRMDVDYVRNISIARDLKILFLTIPAVVLCRGAS